MIGGTKNLEIVHAAGEKRISPSLVTLEGIRRFSGVKSFQKVYLLMKLFYSKYALI